MTVDIDTRVLALTVGTTAAGRRLRVPAYLASRADTVAVLRDRSRGSTSRGVAGAGKAIEGHVVTYR
jgi:hypothetical protein